jgi:hypothetical protein
MTQVFRLTPLRQDTTQRISPGPIPQCQEREETWPDCWVVCNNRFGPPEYVPDEGAYLLYTKTVHNLLENMANKGIMEPHGSGL